jgi:hypothetical protein
MSVLLEILLVLAILITLGFFVSGVIVVAFSIKMFYHIFKDGDWK